MRSARNLEASLAEPAPAAVFTHDEIAGLPEPVARYFSAAIAPGTPLARSARLRMRGHIKLARWLPFRARQVINPHRGMVWSARVGGVVVGADRYAEGIGGMDWKLGGLVTLVRAEDADVARSSAERAGGEGFWVPTALLPRFGVTWTAFDDRHVSATFAVDRHQMEVHYALDRDGRVCSIWFDRWGDPDRLGTWATHPFGCEVIDSATFDGVTVPTAGRAGWFHGTNRWNEGIFFRFELRDLRLLTSSPGECVTTR